MTSNWLERKLTLIRCENSSKTEVDLGEPDIFHGSCIPGLCPKTMWNKPKIMVDSYGPMFESRISLGATERLPYSVNLRHFFRRTYYMGKVNLKKVLLKDIVSWRTTRFNNSGKYLLHASMTTVLQRKNWIMWENSNCSEMLILGTYWTTQYWLWKVNKIARSITMWTKATQQTIISFDLWENHHTSGSWIMYCHVGCTPKECRLVLFQDSDFAGDFVDSISTSGGTIVRISAKLDVCSNQLDV